MGFVLVASVNSCAIGGGKTHLTPAAAAAAAAAAVQTKFSGLNSRTSLILEDLMKSTGTMDSLLVAAVLFSSQDITPFLAAIFPILGTNLAFSMRHSGNHWFVILAPTRGAPVSCLLLTLHCGLTKGSSAADPLHGERCFVGHQLQ